MIQMPTVGIWIMPNNNDSGAIETFYQSMIKADDQLLSYAAQCISQLPERRFDDVHEAKALMHTWLAWQKEPGMPMGKAITKQFLDFDAAEVQPFLAWARRLFEAESAD